MSNIWIKAIIPGICGGLLVKLLDVVYQEYRRKSESHQSANLIVEKHIDPLLKAADELVGKIRSLAQSDFQTLKKIPDLEKMNLKSWSPYLSIIYLFAQFWARIQILRLDSISINLGIDERGKQLQSFFKALEGTKSRLVDRAWQRGMGEALLKEIDNENYRILTYKEFVDCYLDHSEEFKRWFEPLLYLITNTNDSNTRQRILVYGVILKAFIDTLDKNHLATRKRPNWANKLSKKSSRTLKYRIFRIYLNFVEYPEQYYIKNFDMNNYQQKNDATFHSRSYFNL